MSSILESRSKCDPREGSLFGSNTAATDLAARIAPFARAVPKPVSSPFPPPADFSGSFARQGVDWLLGQSLNCTLASKVSRGLERGLVITQARISARCYDQPRWWKIRMCFRANLRRRVASPGTRVKARGGILIASRFMARARVSVRNAGTRTRDWLRPGNIIWQWNKSAAPTAELRSL